jgi:ribosomal protein S18
MASSLRLVLASCSRFGGVPVKSAGNLLQTKSVQPAVSYATRFFSKDGDDDKKKDEHDDDPFGVNFEDGNEHGKLGTTLPPRYRRDSMTGKFTGEEEDEMTESKKQLLKMDPVQEQEYLLEKVFNDWDLSEEDESGGSQKLSELARRVRQDNVGLNTLGRSVESQSLKSKVEDGEDGYADKTGFAKPLSPAEFKVFKQHMKDEYKTQIDDDDIPVEPTSGNDSVLGGYADNEYLNTKWMSSTAVRFMDDTKDDDPFSDLLPSDLSPARLVNRRKAKPIPKQLLHHNNLALLRRYITPTGQIMNRVQSRLGAKDQRKVAKLIKRARALGLLPTAGQFAVEAHGNIYEKDLDEDRDWEKELKRRGLVVKSVQKAD